MEAKEIRIGNWYDHNGEHKKVTPSVIEEVWNAERQWCKPIPLTPEILEKAGWFVIEKNKKYINNERGIITVSFDELGMVMYKIGDMNFTTVHNVHQLQNLYFALTGEELKIEL